MTYFAAAVVRGTGGWSGIEIDLDGADDLEEVAERLREVDPDAQLSLLLLEVDDEFLAIMRVDNGDEPRVFVSDAGFAAETKVGELLIAELEPVSLSGDGVDPGEDPSEDDEDEPVDHEVEDDLTGGVETDGDPVGDPDLLADLGTPARELLRMCAHEGTMPADVLVSVCERAGCGDVLEELREA